MFSFLASLIRGLFSDYHSMWHVKQQVFEAQRIIWNMVTRAQRAVTASDWSPCTFPSESGFELKFGLEQKQMIWFSALTSHWFSSWGFWWCGGKLDSFWRKMNLSWASGTSQPRTSAQNNGWSSIYIIGIFCSRNQIKSGSSNSWNVPIL